MKLHVLKILPCYYREVMAGRKKAELRKDDRNFKCGDLLHFTTPEETEYDGMFNLFIITHITPCRDIMGDKCDYVMLSIMPFDGEHRYEYQR